MERFDVGLPEYIAAGGNRHPAAADWDRQTGLLAFGADRNIALWHAEVSLDFFSRYLPLKDARPSNQDCDLDVALVT